MYPSPGTGPTPPKFRPIGRFLVGPRGPLYVIRKAGGPQCGSLGSLGYGKVRRKLNLSVLGLKTIWTHQSWVNQPDWACDPTKKKTWLHLDLFGFEMVVLLSYPYFWNFISATFYWECHAPWQEVNHWCLVT
jgi:hypothetical protein